MNCDTTIDLVVDSLMDRLDPEEGTALEQHLASCSQCAADAEQMRSMWQGLEDVTPPIPSGETFIRFGRRLERSRRSVWSTGLKAAAGIALLLGGAFIGRLTGSDVTPAGVRDVQAPTQSYLLVIRGNEPNRRFPDTPLMPAYRAWEGDLERQGILVAAEKLRDDGGRWVNDLAPADDATDALAVRGFFLIRAESYEDAVLVARESPHIAYGGTIEVRQIEPE